MNKEIKARWLEALRSGEFIQGRQQFRPNTNPPTHCCLAVLVEVMTPGATAISQSTRCHKTAYILAGLTEGDIEQCISLNDGTEGYTDVAAYIEENL
jgi:hypothetical protein